MIAFFAHNPPSPSAGMHSNGFSGAYRLTWQVMRAGASEVVTTEDERECRPCALFVSHLAMLFSCGVLLGTWK
jgi:hypothetical protein